MTTSISKSTIKIIKNHPETPVKQEHNNDYKFGPLSPIPTISKYNLLSDDDDDDNANNINVLAD